MRKTIEQMLGEGCENDYGYYDASVGTDMGPRLITCTESAIRTMLKRGYLEKRGIGLILTRTGYNAAQ